MTAKPRGGRHRKRPDLCRRTMSRRLAVYPASAMVGLLVFGGVNQQSPPAHPVTNTDHTRIANPGDQAAVNGVESMHGPRSGPVQEAGFVVRATEAAVPATVFDAYQRAAAAMATQSPACRLSWSLLAGIGRVESDNADGGDVAPDGELLRPILGPVLDGSAGTAAVPNTMGTAWGQSGPWARAVGPMQFLPSTWRRWGADGNGDGVADPNNVYDAAFAAARYLCSGGGDLSTAAGQENAIFSYNHSTDYVAEVLDWMSAYQAGGAAVPDDLTAIGADDFNPPASDGQADTVPPGVTGTARPPGPAPSPPPSSTQPAPPPSRQPAPPPPGTSVPPVPGPVGQVLSGVTNAVVNLLPTGTLQNTLNSLLP